MDSDVKNILFVCSANIAKAHTLKVLDGMMMYKDKDGDRMYTNIVKTIMKVNNNEI